MQPMGSTPSTSNNNNAGASSASSSGGSPARSNTDAHGHRFGIPRDPTAPITVTDPATGQPILTGLGRGGGLRGSGRARLADGSRAEGPRADLDSTPL